jgi:hypothetical protein
VGKLSNQTTLLTNFAALRAVEKLSRKLRCDAATSAARNINRVLFERRRDFAASNVLVYCLSPQSFNLALFAEKHSRAAL